MVWYSHLFKSCPQFVMIHTVKGFSVVNEAEVDVFFLFFVFFSGILLLSPRSTECLAVWSLPDSSAWV